MTDFAPVKEYLNSVRARDYSGSLERERELLNILEEIRVASLVEGDQTRAKLTWFYKTALKIQSGYLTAFAALKSELYYDAWCILEDVELSIASLDMHFGSMRGYYDIELVGRYVEQYQSLFPYRLFLSPAFVANKKSCSICGIKTSIRNPCGHIPGEIYDGMMCCRVVEEADLLEISFVENPVNKYAVAFMVDPLTNDTVDHYNYALVRYVISGLRKPFDDWTPTWTTRRQPHSRFKNRGRNSKCPCGSDKKYKACCLGEDGVLQPHLEIYFSVPPPVGLPKFSYVGDLLDQQHRNQTYSNQSAIDRWTGKSGRGFSSTLIKNSRRFGGLVIRYPPSSVGTEQGEAVSLVEQVHAT